jgi:hypothetical protein
MPNPSDDVLIHAISGYELSRVRTELYRLRILAAVPPHPVQTHGPMVVNQPQYTRVEGADIVMQSFGPVSPLHRFGGLSYSSSARQTPVLASRPGAILAGAPVQTLSSCSSVAAPTN